MKVKNQSSGRVTSSPFACGFSRHSFYSSAFTLVELLVTIGIIVVLIAIALPLAGRIRKAAYAAQTHTAIAQIAAAIETYNNDFHAYPGPLKNDEVSNKNLLLAAQVSISTTDTPTILAQGYVNSDANIGKQITMSENLILGIMGGLKYDTTDGKIVYDPRLVGQGANSLNSTGPVKKSIPYLQDSKYINWRTEAGLKTGHFVDDAGAANDTIIPEPIDAYPDPMPILYMRAKKGAVADPTKPLDETNNAIVTYDPNETGAAPFRIGQYDLHQVIGYTDTKIGVSKKLTAQGEGWTTGPIHGLYAKGADKVDVMSTNHSPAPTGLKHYYPYNAYSYLKNSTLSSPAETDSTYTTPTNPRNDVAFQKDGYILISAGPDRIYGTADDITNFGAVGQ